MNVGPVVRLSPNEIDISDLKAVRQIHQTGSGFLKASWYQKLSPPGVENLFVTTNPQFHSRHRRLLSTPLSDSSLRLAEPLIDSRVQLTIQRMREQMDTNGVVDVYEWWVFMSTDIIGELSFGESFELLENGKV
jgi:cytochrome P450